MMQIFFKDFPDSSKKQCVAIYVIMILLRRLPTQTVIQTTKQYTINRQKLTVKKVGESLKQQK